MKKLSLKSVIMTVAVGSFLFAGCSKQEGASNSTANSNVPNANTSENSSNKQTLQNASSQGGQETATSALPKPDPNVPLSQYIPLKSGNQVMFMYYAISNLPVDYDEIASRYSADYNQTSDVFKKQQILDAIKPRINEEIAAAKQNRYFYIIDDANLDHYDFNLKGFPVNSPITDPDAYGYFYDNSDYHYTFTNGDKYKLLKVADTDKAKMIESIVSQHGHLKLKVYAFAQDADLNSKTVRAQIVKVELLDPKGNVLTTQ